MGRKRKWGLFPVTTKLWDAVCNAHGDLECLRDEVEEWRSGMEGTGLESTGKYSMLEEAGQQLETAIDNLDEVISGDCPSVLEDISITYHEERRKSMSRARRLGNCTRQIDIAYDGVLMIAGDLDAEGSDEEMSDRLTVIRDALEAAQSEIESVEFPGMFS